MIGRRKFVRDAMAGAATLSFAPPMKLAGSIGSMLAGSRAVGSTADSRIEVLLDEELGTISPNVYGHFLEHIGGVIYDGVWVGENSTIPNIAGIRKDLIDEMHKIKAPIVRYPGGCFADSYNWRDGVGPVDQRPKRTNFWIEADSTTSPAKSANPGRSGT